jgi:hypothetical protein
MSFGVIARKAGTAASGSTITNSELSANKMYSSRSMEIELEAVSAQCQWRVLLLVADNDPAPSGP